MFVGLNTYLVLFSAASIGIACAVVGCYIMLYKKSLVTDAVSHATLPGVAIGFFLSYFLDLDDGRFLPLLLIGAALTGYICLFSINWITKHTRLHADAAIASMLAFFFGIGVVLLSVIQNFQNGSRTGLDSFLFGQIAGTTIQDSIIILIGSTLSIFLCLLYSKTFILRAFDTEFSSLQLSKPDQALHYLTLLMLVVICLGLKTVGAILILALLIIPASTARLLFNNMLKILVTSIIIGFFSTLTGATLSLYIDNMPTGPAIIMVLFIGFLISVCISGARNIALKLS